MGRQTGQSADISSQLSQNVDSREGRISVCILTYNHAEVIRSTVESVLNQTLAPCEILISDDCSTDGTWELLLELARADSRIKVVQTPGNRGMAGNANFAVSLCVGEYIALLHHDDIYRCDLLEKWSGVLENHPSVSFVFNSYANLGIDRIDEVSIPAGRIDGEWLLKKFLLARWGCPIRGTAMIRRSAWDRAGGMPVEFGLLADVYLWMRLCMIGPVGYVAEPLITVRHARPDDYPDIYKESHWSWQRLVYLYRIHGRIREEYYAGRGLLLAASMLLFRIRVSIETTKWIGYAIVKRKREMLESCGASRNQYDTNLVRGLRALTLKVVRLSLK